MNGKVAKKIRKEVYGKWKEIGVSKRAYDEQFGGQLISVGKRRQYKLAKKEYNLKKIYKLREINE